MISSRDELTRAVLKVQAYSKLLLTAQSPKEYNEYRTKFAAIASSIIDSELAITGVSTEIALASKDEDKQ